MNRNYSCGLLAVFFFFLCPMIPLAGAQEMSNYNRVRVLTMLDKVSKDIQKHYYDPKYHGLDWNATVQEERQKIKAETSLNIAMAHIAQALVSLNDSHTFFLPPPRPYIHDYGFQTEMIGDKCYIIRVRPGTDAAAKDLKPGDQLLAQEGIAPSREILWKMEYRFNVLRPAPGLRLILRDPQGQQRQVDVAAKFKQLSDLKDITGEGIWDVVRDAEDQAHLMRPRWSEVGEDVQILKLPNFVIDPAQAEGLVDRARKRSALIIDLRENPGGAVDTLKRLLGGMFENDVKIANRVGRKEYPPEIAKSRGHAAFAGKLVVLVDSRSASAAELFARVVQLEKRGVVMGDRSSGSVMEAKRYTYDEGIDVKLFYGAEITEADLVMSDGKSLEGRGVTPDEAVLPTAADLAAGRDPVLARAAAILGAKLTPEEAGKLFPYEWPNE